LELQAYASLSKLGFNHCSTKHYLYTRSGKKARLIVGVYVDDLLVVGESMEEIGKFKREMMQTFRMSDLGTLSYYLGIEVKQGEQDIELCQNAYAAKLLDRVGLGKCNGTAAPMEARLKLSKRSTSPLADATVYRSIIGSLRYLLHTRPDLSFSVGYLSWFMSEPREDHMAALKHLLRYVAATKGHGLKCKRDTGEICLTGYSDNDLASDVDDRRSTMGVLFFLGENPVSWLSQKQKAVTKSSCEAEYMTSTAVASQAVWLRRVLEEVIGIAVPVPTIRMDNTAAITLAKNHVLHDRNKHIDVKFHFTRECVERGDINLEHVRTGDELTDILTKALGRVHFQELCGRIGVLKVSSIKP
jgi:hypothetical protein